MEESLQPSVCRKFSGAISSDAWMCAGTGMSGSAAKQRCSGSAA